MMDFTKAWRRVVDETEDQEARNQALLVGQLTLKANADPKFRQELHAQPKSVIQREAVSLSIEPNERMVDAVGRAFSAAIPGADIAKVQKLVFDTVDDMRRSFKMTLELSRWLFFAGLGMVALAFLAALFSDRLWATGVAGGSGVLSLLLSAVMNPLDRIRGAAADLAQVQAAYLAFYKQLYILGTSTETLTRADAISYSEELRKAAAGMVGSVGSVLAKGGPEPNRRRNVSHIGHSFDPGDGRPRPERKRPAPARATAKATVANASHALENAKIGLQDAADGQTQSGNTGTLSEKST